MASSVQFVPAADTAFAATSSNQEHLTDVPGSYDFDLHGLVGIRLVGATPRDRDAIVAQLGPIASPLHREPDIVLRFESPERTLAPMRLIGDGDSAFTEKEFFILRAKHRTPTRVQMPFDDIGGRCEIVCEHGIPAVPLLIPIINLIVLSKGGLALHASAFRYDGTGVLVTGWSKGGKTELLLSFIERGAEYIGDEWIYISPDGARMFGVPEPIRVWDWQLSQLPHYSRHIKSSDSRKLRSLRRVRGSVAAAAAITGAITTRGSSLWRRVANLVEGQRYAFLSPASAFGSGLGSLCGRPDRVVFVASEEGRDTRLDPVSPSWIANRMAFSLEEERSVFMAYYRRFRFAFPERSNALIDGAAALESERLHRFLQSRPCYTLYHPYPPRIRELFSATLPVFP